MNNKNTSSSSSSSTSSSSSRFGSKNVSASKIKLNSISSKMNNSRINNQNNSNSSSNNNNNNNGDNSVDDIDNNNNNNSNNNNNNNNNNDNNNNNNDKNTSKTNEIESLSTTVRRLWENYLTVWTSSTYNIIDVFANIDNADIKNDTVSQLLAKKSHPLYPSKALLLGKKIKKNYDMHFLFRTVLF